MRLLWCSDSVILPTGYAQVSRNILSRLIKTGIDCVHLGFQNQGMPIVSSQLLGTHIPFPQYFQIHNGEFYGNQGSVEFMVEELKPEITTFLVDSFMIRWLSEKDKEKANKLKEKTKLWFYFPFDSKDVYEGAKDVMECMDIRIAMSKWARELLKKDAGLDSFYIPHAVDTNVYHPLSKDKTEPIKKQNNWEGKFIVGSVARNQSRKMMPILMEAFANFANGKEDVILFLHCDPKDPQGHNLIDFAERIGIQKKVIFGMKRYSLGLPEQNVNLAYNMMDMHVLSTTGEGFGLPIVESMAAGVPNICTDYTTAKELLSGCGELVRLARGCPYIIGQLNTHRALADMDDLERKMNKLYNNESLRKKYAEKGRRRILDHYNWEKILRKWIELIQYGEIYEPD